ILPSNSTGVHSLWVPSIPLKVPLVLKPGREEPWTPYRIVQAFLEAGVPPEAFSYYPTDYAGSAEILLRCDRSMLFGGGATVAPWQDDPRVQIHGPGQSKIIFGSDAADRWEDALDIIVSSVSANGGRSCINVSSVWTPAHADEIAQGLAERLAEIQPRPLTDPEAGLCAFLNVRFAEMIDQMIDSQLKQDGAHEVTAGHRLLEVDGLTYLRPTVVRAEDPSHSLADSEFLFPFASVVEVPQEELLDSIGPSLVVSAITEDERFIRKLLDSPKIERLNIGALGTQVVSWDQPHEGNLFEHLYTQRALQRAS
ncbi:aldehyde dehydrogenase family protein, partial [bacterium]|nr:aldehyde dehydrogenase family protein [bacterium]